MFTCVTNFILFQKYNDLIKKVTKKIKFVAKFLTSTSTIAILLENLISATIDMIYIYILEQLKEVNVLDAI